MKNVILFSLFLAFSVCLSAQNTGGPDTYGYVWKNSYYSTNPPAYSWFDITTIGTQVTGLADDNVAGPFTVSSGFQYYWYPTPKFWIGSNGFITFDGDNIASPFAASIPLSSGANNFIAPLLSDLNFTGAGNQAKCYYYSSPDTLCISFIDVPFWINATPPYTGNNTFQIILNRADKSITFNYQSMDLGTKTSLDNIVGIENVSGTIGLTNMVDSLPDDLFTIKFYYPDSVTYAVTDGGMNWNGNDHTGGSFIVKDQPHTLKANVRNFGNQVLTGFSVKDTVYSSSGAVMSTGTAAVAGLGVQTEATVTLSNAFTPAQEGHYSFRSALSGVTGDMVPDNDRLTQEIIAIDTSQVTYYLDYSDGIKDGSGLGWNGGGGGIAIYIEPPVYPVKIYGSQFYITANATTPVGFYAMIYDDDGPGGSAGTLLDSVYVPPSGITLNAYIGVVTANLPRIDSGGVYLYWRMGGAGINLARDITPPISRRTYEVLLGGWAEYRDKLTEDFLMGLVVMPDPPTADFGFDLGQDPLVQFLDSSSSNTTAWLWDFDDAGATSSLQNPTHSFSAAGAYNVCLTASNGVGMNTKCQTVTIQNELPVANFTYDTTIMPTVAFSDASSNSPTAWLWDFDDAGDDTSSAQNPTFTFSTNGNHNVCLTVSNVAGTSQPYCKLINAYGVGINEWESNSGLLVYPNPFEDEGIIAIQSDKKLGELRLNCYSVTGKVCDLNYTIHYHQVKVNTRGLVSGTYLFELFSENELLGRGRFVVK
ncbi:MAG TPA: PKD domain-containing protein [Bacteroidales bacterium]|nr:PKD domain-containing protein [Bacteroidales bacterium]